MDSEARLPRIEAFERDGVAMIAMSRADWNRIEDELEDAMLSKLADEARATDSGPGIPAILATLILDGVHPLKAYREYRGLTQAELAKAVDVQQPAIARLEKRERAGRPALLAKLALILDMPLETLIDFGGLSEP
jgi:DNA-binding XRE family transcriptional regulator